MQPKSNTTIEISSEIVTDYALDTGVVVEGQRKKTLTRIKEYAMKIPKNVRPVLFPCSRVYVDMNNFIHICLPITEPVFKRGNAVVIIRRIIRDAKVIGSTEVMWALLKHMDGILTISEILKKFDPYDRDYALDTLGSLAFAGLVDISDRSIGRFIHSATKKGVLAGGGLTITEALQQVTDNNYRRVLRMPIIHNRS